jgi:hypothetical protein
LLLELPVVTERLGPLLDLELAELLTLLKASFSISIESPLEESEELESSDSPSDTSIGLLTDPHLDPSSSVGEKAAGRFPLSLVGFLPSLSINKLVLFFEFISPPIPKGCLLEKRSKFIGFLWSLDLWHQIYLIEGITSTSDNSPNAILKKNIVHS